MQMERRAEQGRKEALMVSVWEHWHHAVAALLFIAGAAGCAAFLVAATTRNEEASAPPHPTVLGLAAGWVLLCLYTVHPLLLPRPGPSPRPHGPFRRAVDAKGDVSSVLLLVNPAAGQGQGERVAAEVAAPHFRGAGIAVEVVFTSAPGHGIDLLRTLPLADFDAVVVVGGDGTVHEVVNGMLSRSDGVTRPVGLVPAGTGNSLANDFRAVVDLSDPLQACRLVTDGFTTPMDLNLVTFGPAPSQRVYSVNIVGYASDQCTGSINIDSWRGWLGRARYDVCALWGLLKGRLRRVRLTIDGRRVTAEASHFWVNHTQHMGRGMKGCGRAYLDDGLLDCCEMGQESRARLLRVFNGVKGGGWHEHVAAYHQGVEATFEFQTDEGLINIDGETCRFEGGKVHVKCVPAIVRVFAPPQPADEQ